ncbi:MAG: DUF116 domain-containing protein [bacterium]
MEKTEKKFFKIVDRKLGDEWQNWDGSVESYNNISHAGKRIYMGLLLVSIIVGGGFCFFIWYMIYPRLEEFHPSLPLIIGLLIFVLWLIVALWFLVMVFSIMTEKDLLMKFRGKEFSVTFFVPLVFKLGSKLGISTDLLGHSFVEVSNALIKTSKIKVNPENLLVLLPRCLKKDILNKISAYSKKLNIPTFIVGGGEKARELIYKIKPKAIIGVACERDLLSGIRDVVDMIPVIGIPNKRPEGPCKNTIIDFHEFQKAVNFFLKNDTLISKK